MDIQRHKGYMFNLFVVLHTYFFYALGQLTFPPSQINIQDGGMNFYFEFFNKNKTIRMGLEMNRTVDYFSIGFSNIGNWGMKNFDMVAFIFIPSGSGSSNVNILDLYSTKNSQPPTDTSLGGTADYKLIDSYVGDGRTQVLFERPYDTGDRYDYIFHPDQNETNVVISWAWLSNGKHTFSYHGSKNRGTFISQMYNGLQSNALSDSSNAETITKIHSYMMLVAWAILIDVALWIGRYHKSSKYVIAIHLWLNLLIYAMTIVMTALILSADTGGDDESTTSAHLYIGLIMLGIILLQVGIGFLFRYKMVNFKITKTIFPLSQAHLVLGILLYLIAKAQIMIGLYMFKPKYVGILWGWYGILLVCWLCREYFYRQRQNPIKKNVKNSITKGPNIEKYKLLMGLLNNNTPVPNILENPELKGMKWAILDSNVFEIKDFTHPGGNFMLNEIHGKEIGRYVFGVIGLESFMGDSKHHHSKDVNAVVQKNLIGMISNGQKILIPLAIPGTEQHLLPVNKRNSIWSLSKKVDLSSHTAILEFKCTGYEIDPWVKDIRHLGKHMKVSCISHSKTRLYTLVLSQTECRSKRRNLLLSKIDKDAQLAADLLKTNSKVFPLLVKKYQGSKSKTFSSFLHNSKLDTHKFIIEGPFGTGLDLTPESTGIHYILAAGTGIFPFLDLFDYLLESVLISGSSSNIFKNGFKLYIFASFGQISDFVGLDICEKLIQACRDNGMNDAVKMTLRSKDAKENELFGVTKEVFDTKFMQKYVDPNCEKAYVCGTPIFNQQVPLALEKVGLTKSKIMLI